MSNTMPEPNSNNDDSIQAQKEQCYSDQLLVTHRLINEVQDLKEATENTKDSTENNKKSTEYIEQRVDELLIDIGSEIPTMKMMMESTVITVQELDHRMKVDVPEMFDAILSRLEGEVRSRCELDAKVKSLEVKIAQLNIAGQQGVGDEVRNATGSNPSNLAPQGSQTLEQYKQSCLEAVESDEANRISTVVQGIQNSAQRNIVQSKIEQEGSRLDVIWTALDDIIQRSKNTQKAKSKRRVLA